MLGTVLGVNQRLVAVADLSPFVCRMQLACFEGLVLKGCRAAPNKVPDWPDVVGALLKEFPGEVPALTKGQWRQQVWKRIRALRNKGVQGVPTVGEVAQHMREEKEREAAGGSGG
jgi:hypothetical protein